MLIGHSLGGLVVKMMLRRAQAEKNRRAESFIDRVRKVAFLATPHSGADLARLADLLRVLVRPSAATISLVRNDAYLRELNERHRDLARDREIIHLILTERRPLIVRRKLLGIIYFRKNLGSL
jgi:pimeloyl-ACP methyl ester carboxylesterase